MSANNELPCCCAVTRTEFDAWNATYRDLLARIKALSEQIQGSKSGPGGVHIDRLELDRQRRLLESKAEYVRGVLSRARIVHIPSNPTRVSFGTIVTIDHSERGTMRIKVGGFGSSDPHASPPVVSYDSLLASVLVGLKVGDCAEMTVRGKSVYLDITQIELDPADTVLRQPETKAAA